MQQGLKREGMYAGLHFKSMTTPFYIITCILHVRERQLETEALHLQMLQAGGSVVASASTSSCSCNDKINVVYDGFIQQQIQQRDAEQAERVAPLPRSCRTPHVGFIFYFFLSFLPACSASRTSTVDRLTRGAIDVHCSTFRTLRRRM